MTSRTYKKDEMRKRPRSVAFTDLEWEYLTAHARSLGVSTSAYIAAKLGIMDKIAKARTKARKA